MVSNSPLVLTIHLLTSTSCTWVTSLWKIVVVIAVANTCCYCHPKIHSSMSVLVVLRNMLMQPSDCSKISGILSHVFTEYRYVKVPIFTLCVGNAWGEAALLLAAGAKGNRAALPSSTIMIKQVIFFSIN